MKNRRILSLFVIAAFALFVGWMSDAQPWLGDDAEYMFCARPDLTDFSDRPIRSMRDVFVSQYYHYFGLNGRTVAHVLVQGFCGVWGHRAFAVCNAAVYSIFLLLLVRLLRIPLHRTRKVLALVSIVALTFGTRYGPACQINYIWMFSICLFFLLILRRISQRVGDGNTLLWLPLFLCSLIAGWGQEALNFGLLFAFSMYAVSSLLRLRFAPTFFEDIGLTCPTRRSPVAVWLMLFGFAVGTILILASPGAWHRLGEVGRSIPLINPWQGLLAGMRVFWLLIIYIVYLLAVRRQTSLRDIVRPTAFTLTAIALLQVFNLIVGIMGYRQFFGIELLSIIALFTLLSRYGLPFGHPRIWSAAVACAAIMLSCSRAMSVYAEKNRRDELVSLIRYTTNAKGHKELCIDKAHVGPDDYALLLGIARQAAWKEGYTVEFNIEKPGEAPPN